MTTPAAVERENPDAGVWYERSDYVGFWQRFLIDLIDGFVLLIYWTAAYVAVVLSVNDYASQVFFAALVGGAFGYLVLLKHWGVTVGYLIANSQVVNLQGERPSILALSIRCAFIFLGPGNTLLDLVWLTGDRHRQALRDKFARTYVIKRGRQPAGRGRIRFVRLDMLGYNVLIPEVAND